MTSEQRQTAYITFSVLVMPLIAAVLAFGVFMVFEMDRFSVSSEMFTPPTADVDILYHDGISALNMARYEVAEARFREALKLFPESATLHNKLGQTLVEQERHLEAVLAYRRAIALNPKLADAHYNLGEAYQAIERYDEAEQAYLSALDIDGTYALAHIGLGELYLADRGSGDCLSQSQSQLC